MTTPYQPIPKPGKRRKAGKAPKIISKAKERRNLIHRLDKLVGDAVKARDGHRCQWPGCVWKQTLNWCHFKGRAIMSLRWDMDNTVTFCVGHHRYTERNADEFVEFMQKRLGPEKYDRLIMRRNAVFKTSVDNLRLLIKSMEP